MANRDAAALVAGKRPVFGLNQASQCRWRAHRCAPNHCVWAECEYVQQQQIHRCASGNEGRRRNSRWSDGGKQPNEILLNEPLMHPSSAAEIGKQS